MKEYKKLTRDEVEWDEKSPLFFPDGGRFDFDRKHDDLILVEEKDSSRGGWYLLVGSRTDEQPKPHPGLVALRSMFSSDQRRIEHLIHAIERTKRELLNESKQARSSNP